MLASSERRGYFVFYLFVGNRYKSNGVYHYERRGHYESLSDAVWNFFDYKKSITNYAGKLFDDMELHLSTDEILLFGEDNGIILSCYNGLNNDVIVKDNLKEYFDYNN